MSPWLIVLLVVAAVAALYCILAVAEAYYLWSPPQIVRCPETGRPARVQLDATLAALTALPGPPKSLVKECDRWPERQDCDQRCLADAGGRG